MVDVCPLLDSVLLPAEERLPLRGVFTAMMNGYESCFIGPGWAVWAPGVLGCKLKSTSTLHFKEQ